MIKLQITRFRDPTEKEAEVAKAHYNKHKSYGSPEFNESDVRKIEEDCLSIEITAKQFETIRKAVLTEF